MYKIYVNTSDRHKQFAHLLKDGKVIGEIENGVDPVVMVRELLQRAKLTPADISEFEANPGPGSFTGLKIGVTAINVLNWALGRKKASELQMPEYGSEPNIHKTKWIESSPTERVREYFNTFESRWGYSLLLRGIKHFVGYYPEGKMNISIVKAQHLMEDKIAEKTGLPARSLWLDAGCGEGKVAIYLAQEYGYRIEGVDLMQPSIQRADREIKKLGLSERVKVRIGDYTSLDFVDKTFDGVYTMETLVHVANYKDALKEFYRVLKPGGKLILFEYSVKNWEKLSLEQQKVGNLIVEASGMHGLLHFQEGSLEKFVEEAGFKHISTEDATQKMFPMLRIFHIIAWFPYQIIKLLGLQRQFVNVTASVEFYKLRSSGDFGSYTIITAVKPTN